MFTVYALERYFKLRVHLSLQSLKLKRTDEAENHEFSTSQGNKTLLIKGRHFFLLTFTHAQRVT